MAYNDLVLSNGEFKTQQIRRSSLWPTQKVSMQI